MFSSEPLPRSTTSPPAHVDLLQGGHRNPNVPPYSHQLGFGPAPSDHPDLRVWPAVFVPVVAIIVSTVIAAATMVLAGILIEGNDLLSRPDVVKTWIETFPTTKLGVFVLILPGQLVLLATVIVAGCLSSEPFCERIGLVEGRVPRWHWILLVLATPMIGIVTTLVVTRTFEMSDQLLLMERIFRAHNGGFFVVLVGLLSVVPGFVEELLFRGFLQRRMEKRFPAVFAIFVSAMLFAVGHSDLVHILGVMPLGLWLGLIAWRTGSVWPAILCHITNNAFAVLVAKRTKEISMEVPMDTLTIGMLVVSGSAFFVSLVLLIQAGSSDERL